ncbi:hypothetical protein G7Y89_g454 [Cudoniella acicularis]|uniref:25S rRNA (Uridine(2843)-N(3))-methyltransferase n=1 Tax=Cudoniella acicularis TaxID=354080 RepID=A0A8H4W8U8_9HELO|nr:hypothetical protein G7Y89_g454 [Cudoniella acicularis]
MDAALGKSSGARGTSETAFPPQNRFALQQQFKHPTHVIQASQNPPLSTMGKNGRFGKLYGKVVSRDDDSRPGWKGPSFTKKTEVKTKAKPGKSQTQVDAENDEQESEPEIPIKIQQLLLNCFRDTFPVVLSPEVLQPVLQEVKAALFERDFAKAFGKSEFLEAYAARWSPSRALCYTSILFDIQEHLNPIYYTTGAVEPMPATNAADVLKLQVACIGGGAAEVIAFGGFIKLLQGVSPEPKIGGAVDTDLEISPNSERHPKVNLVLVDTAEWHDVVLKLHDTLVNPPPISKYASASARAANSSLIAPEILDTTFRLEDALNMTQVQVNEMVGQRPILVTLLFTLNELYTTSISKTTAFLLQLTISAKPGTLLLVVDSPGSYSETSIGAEAKKYPMKWLLDHTLLDTQKSNKPGEEQGKGAALSWEKVVSEDSKWFRIPETTRYPIPLENMRYQIHMYRRL